MKTKNEVTLDQISQFLAPRKLAIVGASRNPKKFGGTVIQELKDKAFELYPVNPNTDVIQGLKCYRTVDSLPDDVNHLLMVVPKTESASVATQIAGKGVKMVWVQQMSDTPEAIEILEDAGISVISKKCILMFAAPVKGPHRFHRFFVKLFGAYPKSSK
jgi:uncharacterized protein